MYTPLRKAAIIAASHSFNLLRVQFTNNLHHFCQENFYYCCLGLLQLPQGLVRKPANPNLSTFGDNGFFGLVLVLTLDGQEMSGIPF